MRISDWSSDVCSSDLGDEVLLPSPDYPLWSASTILNDGRPVYYRCKVANNFLPDPDEIEALVSSRTRAIVLINPNNPTGASYPRALLERIVAIAAKHEDRKSTRLKSSH